MAFCPYRYGNGYLPLLNPNGTSRERDTSTSVARLGQYVRQVWNGKIALWRYQGRHGYLMTTNEEWEQAMRDFLDRHNPNAEPEEIEVLLAELLNGSDEWKKRKGNTL